MGPRGGVIRRVATAAGLLAWVVWTLLPPGATAAGYQRNRNAVFREEIRVERRATVYVASTDGSFWARLAADADMALKQCRFTDFESKLRSLADAAAFQHEMHDHYLRDGKAAKGKLERQRQRVADLEKAARAIDPAKDPWGWSYAGEKATIAQVGLEQLEFLANEGEEMARRSGQDGDTLDQVVVWLKDKRAAAEQECADNPPPPPPPPVDYGPPRDPNDPGDSCPAQVIEEINRARTNPDAYADGWPRADRESLEFLHNQPPVPALDPNMELDQAAERHAEDQSRTGFTGHVGSDGSKPMRRIQEAGLFSTMTAEVISVGQRTPADAIHQLIIDPDSPTKAHRADLFNPNFTLVGAACAREPRYGFIVVIDLSNPPMKREN